MKKVFLGLALFVGVASLSSCSKGECIDCSSVAGAGVTEICEKDYTDAAAAIMSWEDYRDFLVAFGCTVN